MNAYRKERLIHIAQNLQDLRTGRSLHFSFILDKNKLLCYAANDYRNSHLAHKFGEYSPFKSHTVNYKVGRHSECEVLRQYLSKFGNLDVSGLTLFNVRIDKHGNTMQSKPCQNCQKVLDGLNFKEIIWIK